jgi:hypothetical protein
MHARGIGGTSDGSFARRQGEATGHPVRSAICFAMPPACAKSEAMKLRHAAALALVGWYLMLLPKTGDLPVHVFDVPWSATQRSFDTANECEEARAKAVVPPIPSPATVGKSPKQDEQAFYCIATDDPRISAERLK